MDLSSETTGRENVASQFAGIDNRKLQEIPND
jgi:hypothetical protein